MTLETKYNIDDVVWYIHENRVYSSKIYGVRYIGFTTPPQPETNKAEYKIDSESSTWVKEDELFATKEELLKTL